MTVIEAMTVIELLDELGAAIDRSDDPRSMALFSLGVAIGTAMKHGISAAEIASLDAMRECTLIAARALVSSEPKAPKQRIKPTGAPKQPLNATKRR